MVLYWPGTLEDLHILHIHMLGNHTSFVSAGTNIGSLGTTLGVQRQKLATQRRNATCEFISALVGRLALCGVAKDFPSCVQCRVHGARDL